MLEICRNQLGVIRDDCSTSEIGLVVTERLNNKVAVITGASSGIGLASAQLFAAEGARVLMLDINDAAGKTARNQIKETGGTAEFVHTDCTDENSVAAAFNVLDETFGPLDVLYNCAGGSTGKDAAVDALEVEVLHQVFELELQTAILCSREGLRRMIAHGSGSIINMSSFVAYRGTFQIHAYSSAKGAISALTRAMAGSYAKDGIRVNSIAPGVALTDRARTRIEESNIAANQTFDWKDYPFAVGTPENIASVALFLASEESRMITGQTIVADGGLSTY
jgi:NAD(P)-dependent dehydrogenase (short-subunit alcohol dehydrogenase family)